MVAIHPVLATMTHQPGLVDTIASKRLIDEIEEPLSTVHLGHLRGGRRLKKTATDELVQLRLERLRETSNFNYDITVNYYSYDITVKL